MLFADPKTQILGRREAAHREHMQHNADEVCGKCKIIDIRSDRKIRPLSLWLFYRESFWLSM